MIRPYISKEYRNEEQKKEYLDAQINGEQCFLKGCLLNNGTIVFRTVDVDGYQTEKLEAFDFRDVASYRDEIHPELAIIEATEYEAINKFYLMETIIRVGQKTLFTAGQLIIYKDEWIQNPGKFFSFSLAKTSDTICPNEKITGSLSFYLNNEDIINEQRYMFNNDVRFDFLQSRFDREKDRLPSLQDIEKNHQLLMEN